MAPEFDNNQKLLIQLEEQLKNSNENHKTIIGLVDEIFNKIDAQSKEFFDVKSKLDTLKEVTNLKFIEMEKQIEEVLNNIKETTALKMGEVGRNIETQKSIIDTNQGKVDEFKKIFYEKFETFKKDEFKPLHDSVEQGRGALKLVKFVYPVIAIILQGLGLWLAVYLSNPPAG